MNGETMTLFTNLLLAALTALYVIITKRILDASNTANQQNKDLFLENQRLHLFPHLSCHIEKTSDDLNFVLQNFGDNAGVDVDLLIVASYSEDSVSLKDFTSRHMKRKDGGYPSWKADEEGFYGLYHHYVYYSVPPHRQVRAPLQFPVVPRSVSILMQFRDVVGNNYFRVYWMFGEHDADTRYKMGAMQPHRIKTWSRIDFDLRGDQVVLKTTNGEPLPQELEETYFLKTWSHSISAGYLRLSSRSVEDPGEWSNA